MEFSGSVDIAAPRQAVWDLLLDFDRLARCGPGVESVERLDDRHARVRAKVGVGFMTVGFVVELELVEITEPDRATIRATGSGPGNQVEASGRMELRGPPDGPTTMDYQATVDLFGSLAGVGSRLIESTASRMIDSTFDCVRAQLTPA